MADCLRACPNVQDLQVRKPLPDRPDETSPSSTEHDALQELPGLVSRPLRTLAVDGSAAFLPVLTRWREQGWLPQLTELVLVGCGLTDHCFAGVLPELPVARALWVPRPDFTTSAESWLMAGGPHHTAYTQAVGLDVIRDFADMVGVELVAITADTDAERFRHETAWSNAYWHLAGAI